MLLYLTLYSHYCMPPLSDNIRMGRVRSMNVEREFTVFENDMDWRKRKRLQLVEADEYRTIFAARM